MANRIRLYTSPFTTRNQEIKTLEKLDQVIKQASRDESSDQASISTIKILDHYRSWKYIVVTTPWTTIVDWLHWKIISDTYKHTSRRVLGVWNPYSHTLVEKPFTNLGQTLPWAICMLVWGKGDETFEETLWKFQLNKSLRSDSSTNQDHLTV